MFTLLVIIRLAFADDSQFKPEDSDVTRKEIILFMAGLELVVIVFVTTIFKLFF